MAKTSTDVENLDADLEAELEGLFGDENPPEPAAAGEPENGGPEAIGDEEKS